MRTAVIFCGPVRGANKLAFRWWQDCLPDADYFLITYNKEYGRSIKNRQAPDFAVVEPYDPNQLAFTPKHVIINDIDALLPDYARGADPALQNKSLNEFCFLYNWTKISDIPDVGSYDKIILTRPDYAPYDPNKLLANYIPKNNEILWELFEFDVNNTICLNDYITIVHPIAIPLLGTFYNEYVEHRANNDNYNQFKHMHNFLGEHLMRKHMNIRIDTGKDLTRKVLSAITGTVIRPNYPTEWINEPLSEDLFLRCQQYEADWSKEYMGYNITYAYLETTSFCNLKCTFCNREEVILGLKHMPLLEFEYMLDKLCYQPIKEAKLMGMGEPFMHPQFNVITRRFKETFPNAYVISATNAQIKFNDNFKDAVKYLDMCYLSIDGWGHTFEELRPPASWPKLLNFLTELSAFKSQVKCSFPINFTVCPQNVYDIEKMFPLIEEYNLDGLRLNFVQNWSEDEPADVLNGFTQEQLTYLKQYKKYFKGKAQWDYSDCFWPKHGLYVTVDNNVKVCCMNTSAVPIGNIAKQTVQDIRNGAALAWIRKGCENNTPTPHCAKCSYKELVPFLKMINED